MLKGTLVDVFRVYGRQWWRLALTQLVVLVALSAFIAVVALVVQGQANGLLEWIGSEVDEIDARAGLVAGVAVSVVAVLSTPIQLAGALATIRIADRALDGERPALLTTLARSFGRVLPMLGGFALALGVVVVALIAAPLTVLVGALGLVATGAIALVRLRRTTALTRWPGWRTWLFVAIPLAVLWYVAAPAILTPVAVALEPASPVRAARVAARSASGRRWSILGFVLTAVIVAVGIASAASWLGSALAGEPGAVLLGGIVQFFVTPLPVVVAAVLYRRAAAQDGRPLGARAAAPRRTTRRRPVASPVVARVATVVVATLVLSAGLAIPIAAASSAEAAPAAVGGSSVTYVVSSSVDTVDSAALAVQQASCLAAGPDCTLRAALALAQEAAVGGAVAATITFSADTLIAVSAVLAFAPDTAGQVTPPEETPGDETPDEGETPDEEETPSEENPGEENPGDPQLPPTTVVAGLLTIDSAGHTVELDGGGTTQILSVTSEYWNLDISGLAFRNGAAGHDFGGGLRAFVHNTRLNSTVFHSNTAYLGGAGVFARNLIVTSSSFLNNQAQGDASSSYGGAIFSAEHATVENSTFDNNGVGDGPIALMDRGSDIYTDFGMDVVNSTFVNSKAGSLASQSASSVRNSIFSSNWTQGGGACTGVIFTGGNNLHAQRDRTCPGAGGGSVNLTLLGNRDDSGRVPVFPLAVGNNPASGAGVNCPSVDTFGTPRPVNGCDLGAVEFDGKTTTGVQAIADPTVFGTLTLRATVTTPSGAVAPGTVTFVAGGTTYGPIALAGSTAEVTITGLSRGALDYSADFAPTGPRFAASSTGTLTYQVEPVRVAVRLECANASVAVCSTTPWRIGETASIDVVAIVDGDQHPGSVVIAGDSAGTDILTASTPTVDGQAAFALSGSALGLGAYDLYALFTSDDGAYVGVTEYPRPLSVLRVPTVTVTGTASTGVYGDTTKGTFTVHVTGAGPTPTGAVTLGSYGLTLDANGEASVDLSRYPVRSVPFDVGAVYAGDDAYAARSSSALPFTTTPANTSTAVSAVSPAAPRFDDATTVAVVIRTDSPSTADAEGSVRLVVDGITTLGPVSIAPGTSSPDSAPTDGERVVEFVIAAGSLSSGRHTAVAQFSGNANFTDSVSSAPGRAFVIGKAVTTTDLLVSSSATAWDGAVTLTATVDAPAAALVPIGDLTFTAGGSSLGTVTLIPCAAPNTAGCAVATMTVAASTLGVGTVALSAEYLGASDFAASKDDVTDIAIGKATPLVTVTGAATLDYGNTTNYQIAVRAGGVKPADGTVVTVTAVPQAGAPVALGTVALTSGSATVSVPTAQTLLPGAYTISAAFPGDDHFVAATGAASLAVASAAIDIDFDAISGTSVAYGGSVGSTITVTNTSGTLAPEGDVVLTWSGLELGRVTLSAADTTANGNARTVDIAARFGARAGRVGTGTLIASFVAAPGFANVGPSYANSRVVTVNPLRAKVAVDMTAVLGQPLTASATVSVVGENAEQIVPAGQVRFTVVRGYASTVGPFYADLIDGRATLPANILVGYAGDWTVYATYTTPGGEDRYTSGTPDNFAQGKVRVNAGTAVVTVDAPTALELGAPLTVAVSVIGAVPATGTVTLLNASGYVISPDVALVGGRATISIALPADYVYGDYRFTVSYFGDAALERTRSDSFTVTVGKIGTAIALTTSHQLGGLYPVILGTPVSYTARVIASKGLPYGTMDFYRGSTQIGSVNLDGTSSVATLSVTPVTVWSGDIVAVYRPAGGLMQGSTARLAHSWVAPPVTVSIAGTGAPAIGETARYTATVRYDWSEFGSMPAQYRPGYAPSGTVAFSDGGATPCTVRIAAVDAGVDSAVGSCALPFTTLGARTITATYVGNAAYGSHGTATKSVTVVKGRPTLTISTPGGTSWKGLTTVPVSWSVAGPASGGTVTVKLGDTAVCSSSSLTGTCDAAMPRHGQVPSGLQPAAMDVFTLEYSGTPLWDAAAKTLAGTIVACVTFEPSKVSPAGSATVVVNKAPTCGDSTGTGYYTTDRLSVQVAATAGSTIDSVSDGWETFDDSEVLYQNPRIAALVTMYPTARYAGTRLLPITITTSTTAGCVPVTFQADLSGERLDSNAVFVFQTPRDCPGRVINSDKTVTASVKVGSQLEVGLYASTLPERTIFYGWGGKSGTDKLASSATYTVTANMPAIIASYGPACYHNVPELGSTGGGALTLSLPAPNCTDPADGTSGWTYGTRGTGELTDAPFSATNRTFFESWGFIYGALTTGATRETTDATGSVTTIHPFDFTITGGDFRLSANYGSCVSLSTTVVADNGQPAPGTISVATAPDCPRGASVWQTVGGKAVLSQPWYRSGSSVTLSTASTAKNPTAETPQFLGWSGLALQKGKSLDTTVTTVLTADTTATAFYGVPRNCRRLTVEAVPASAISLSTSFSNGANPCTVMYTPGTYSQGVSGNQVSVSATPATAAAQGAEMVFAWSTNERAANGATEKSSVWTRTPSLSQWMYGDTDVIAYACEFVSITANVRGPSGGGSSATNVSRTSNTALGDFVRTKDGNCATGSDPKSGYGDYAWTVGTQLLPIVTADPVAYTFVGWSGDASGSGDTPDAAVNLVGAGHRAEGSEYHYRITANFDAICHTLSLPSDADKLEVITEPNCPGADASENLYLGGTVVVLHAPDSGSTLFRHWVNGIDATDPDDARWASVVMTTDKTVVAYYSAKSVGEQFTTYGALVGDQMAVASKKMVGFASAAVGAYVKGLLENVTLAFSTVGYIAQGLELLGVHGSAIDGMKNASALLGAMMSLLVSPFDCISAWSSGGDDTAMFAAQNFIGTQLVKGLAGKAKEPPAETFSTLDELKAEAKLLAGTAGQASDKYTAIKGAKGVYDAAASGNVGWESSAYEAWGTQSGASVLGTCMSGKTGDILDSMDKLVP